MFRIAITILLLSFSFVAMTPDADACRCFPPDLVTSYNNNTDVLRVRVLNKRQVGDYVYYRARVTTTYKGCAQPGERIFLKTHVSSATCGIELQGRDYLINSYRDNDEVHRRLPVYPINSCDYNVPFGNLTVNQIEFLDNRYNCCGNECACVNSTMVYCFADPCQVTSCSQGECSSNYCGGCHAEFYNDIGQAVCNPCETDEDCAFNQYCNPDGQCLNYCNSDEDCAEDHWCRPRQNQNQGECAPFQQEGEWCGGFTPVWAQAKCASGLICTDFPPFIADAPGVCRVPCSDNRDCRDDQYCGTGDVCRDDSTCRMDIDCNLKGNVYVHIACVGFGVCNEDQCGWDCEFPQCLNLGGVDFGPCEAIIGWGVIDDRCTMLSGCGSQGYNLFSSEEECKKSCFSKPVIEQL